VSRLRVALVAVTAVAVSGSGCAAHAPRDRRDVVHDMMAASVQLRAEREGGARRAASGVVIARDATGSWIVTTRHFLDPDVSQKISVAPATRPRRSISGEVVARSADSDLALIRVVGLDLAAARLKDMARLGDAVWVVAFPWGRRLTMVSGVVSQLGADSSDDAFEGPASMVDASVSYGASGGGVFDADTGELIALVESHRTARVSLPDARERSLEVPVPGETTVIPVTVIRRFLGTTPLAPLSSP
jgi:S1-C subfamily serine protease